MSRTRTAKGSVRALWSATAFAACSLIAVRARADDDEWKHHRLWVGFTFGLVTEWHPSGYDVCAVDAQRQPTGGWSCAQADGPRYPLPSPDSTVPQVGRVDAGFGGLAAEVMGAAFERAAAEGLLVGFRFGCYFHPTNVNVDGTWPLQSIAEARATWIFGPHPLSRPGVRLYTLFGAGVGDFSARVPTDITTTDANGPQAVSAWRVAGPGFVTTGIGVRIGTPRFAIMIAPLKFALPFGNGSAATLMPELTVMSSPF